MWARVDSQLQVNLQRAQVLLKQNTPTIPLSLAFLLCSLLPAAENNQFDFKTNKPEKQNKVRYSFWHSFLTASMQTEGNVFSFVRKIWLTVQLLQCNVPN